MIKNGYIIDPNEYLIPSFKISPFDTEDIIINKNIKYSNDIDLYFENKLDGFRYKYTTSARQSINIALKILNLKEDDCVTILTTTGNFYISGCVTKEISKFCKWSREFEENTKAIFVNHEFGFPYENLNKLKSYDLPIIEDCAYSFYSNNKEESVGRVGDFVIYSFPKYFPIQTGGLLAYNSKYNVDFEINIDEKKYIQKILSYYIDYISVWSKKRIQNYNYMNEQINSLGLKPRFELSEGITPGVYMFDVNNKVNTEEFKEFLWNQGIENSVFYTEKVMYIPIHNKLDKIHLDYFIECINYFINR